MGRAMMLACLALMALVHAPASVCAAAAGAAADATGNTVSTSIRKLQHYYYYPPPVKYCPPPPPPPAVTVYAPPPGCKVVCYKDPYTWVKYCKSYCPPPPCPPPPPPPPPPVYYPPPPPPPVVTISSPPPPYYKPPKKCGKVYCKKGQVCGVKYYKVKVKVHGYYTYKYYATYQCFYKCPWGWKTYY